ncbi:MAG: hypothetical protein K2X99_07665 [Gemmatimonadaceae bacterium]|nr:hypothetical protein [Gemmatimonadaceae bacterium]
MAGTAHALAEAERCYDSITLSCERAATGDPERWPATLAAIAPLIESAGQARATVGIADAEAIDRVVQAATRAQTAQRALEDVIARECERIGRAIIELNRQGTAQERYGAPARSSGGHSIVDRLG